MATPTGHRARALYKAQGERCFLRITHECRARDGAMSWPASKREAKRMPKAERRALYRAQQKDTTHATIEHIWPRARRAERPSGIPVCLIVIACRACNNAKGGRLPTTEELERAMAVNAAWYAKHPPAKHGWEPNETDGDVPATVAEALAQGGIRA